MANEVTKRIGILRTESARLCKTVLRVRAVPGQTEVGVIQTYVVTRSTFRSGTWPASPDVQYKRLHSCHRNADGNYYKNADCDFDVAAMFSDADIIYMHGFVWPCAMLRMAQLLAFLQAVSKSPPYLFVLAVA